MNKNIILIICILFILQVVNVLGDTISQRGDDVRANQLIRNGWSGSSAQWYGNIFYIPSFTGANASLDNISVVLNRTSSCTGAIQINVTTINSSNASQVQIVNSVIDCSTISTSKSNVTFQFNGTSIATNTQLLFGVSTYGTTTSNVIDIYGTNTDNYLDGTCVVKIDGETSQRSNCGGISPSADLQFIISYTRNETFLNDKAMAIYPIDSGLGPIDVLSNFGNLVVGGGCTYTDVKFGNGIVCSGSTGELNLSSDLRNAMNNKNNMSIIAWAIQNGTGGLYWNVMTGDGTTEHYRKTADGSTYVGTIRSTRNGPLSITHDMYNIHLWAVVLGGGRYVWYYNTTAWHNESYSTNSSLPSVARFGAAAGGTNNKISLSQIIIVNDTVSSNDLKTLWNDGNGLEYIPDEVFCGSYITSSKTLLTDYNCSNNFVTISGSNIDFDCNGHTITTTGSSTNGAIILGGPSSGTYSNVTVRNCNLVNNYSATNYGVAFDLNNPPVTDGYDNLFILNNNISTIGSGVMIGVRLNTPNNVFGVNNSLIQGNRIAHTNSGIVIVPRRINSYNITIRDNLISHTGSLTTGITGIFFALQSTHSIFDSLIYNNTISQNTTSTSNIGFYGVYLNNQNTGDIVSSGINVSSNNIYQSTTIPGTCGSIYLQSTTNARSLYNYSIENNEIYCKGNNSAVGLFIYHNVSNSNFINNNIFVEGSTGGTGGYVGGIYMTTSGSTYAPRDNYFFNNTVRITRFATKGASIGIISATNPASGNIFNETIIKTNDNWLNLDGSLTNYFHNTTFRTDYGDITLGNNLPLSLFNLSNDRINITDNYAFINNSGLSALNITWDTMSPNPPVWFKLSNISMSIPNVNMTLNGTSDDCDPSSLTLYCEYFDYSNNEVRAIFFEPTTVSGFLDMYAYEELVCGYTISAGHLVTTILNGNINLYENYLCSNNFVQISSSNIDLNCNNKTITFNTAGTQYNAIGSSGYGNIDIHDCTFNDTVSAGNNSILDLRTISTGNIYNNIFLANRTSTKIINVSNSNNVVIDSNQIISNGSGVNNKGIYILDSSDIDSTSNNITFLSGDTSYGIDTNNLTRGNINDNIINVLSKDDNNIGIYLHNGNKNITFTSNQIYINGSNNGVGIYFDDMRGFETAGGSIVEFYDINGTNNTGIYYKNLSDLQISAKVNLVDSVIEMEANSNNNFGLKIEEYYPDPAGAFNVDNVSILITGNGTNNTGWIALNSHDINSDNLEINVSTDDSYGFVSHNANDTVLGGSISLDGSNSIGAYIKGDTNTLEFGNIFLINITGDGELYGIKDDSEVESLIVMDLGTILVEGGNGTGILINSSQSNGFSLSNSQIEVTNGSYVTGVEIYNDSSGIYLDTNNIILEGTDDALGLILYNVQGGAISSTYIQAEGDVHSQMIQLDNGAELNVFVDTILNGSENYLASLNLPTNNTFDNTKFATNSGSIRVKPSVDFGPSKAISRNDIIISQNGAFMNSTKLTEFNQSSEIILENISVIAPKIVVDLTDNGTFVDCNTPTCNITSYSANVMTFNVSHFTNYSVQSNATTPSVLINSPVGTTYYTNTILVDITASDPTLQDIWFDWNGTNTSYTVPINVTFANGTNTLTAYANNSFGVVASLDVTFIVETYPLMINQSTVLSQNHSNNDTLIIITGDNLSLDCAGYWLIGSGNGIGIELDGRYNVTIENCNINGFSRNIYSVQTNKSLYQNINSTNSSEDNIVLNLSRENTFQNSRILMSQDGFDTFRIIDEGENILQNIVINGSDQDAISIESASINVLNNISVTSQNIRLGTTIDNRISNIDIQSGSLVLSLGADSNTMNNISINGQLVIGFSTDNDFYNTTVNSSTRAIDFNSAQDNRMNLTYISSSDEWMRTITGAINNLTNTYYLTDEGYIRYPQLVVTAGDALEFNTLNMNVTSNNAYLNSTVLDWLNTSAIIQLNNVPNAISKPVVDFEDDGTFIDCISPNCTILLQNQATFIFNVTHFTSYSTESNGSNITNATGAVLAFNIPPGGSQFVYSLGFETNNTPNRTTAYSTISGTTNTSVGAIPPPNILMDVDVNSWNYFDTLVKNTFGLTILPDLYNRTFGIYFLLNTTGTDGNKVELTFNLTELSEAYYSGFMSDNIINQDSFILTASGYAGGTIPFNSSQDNIPIAITFT